MRINELLTESQQREQLDEGPFGQAVGKAVGGLAKGVGAVAGGVVGMGRALKKGYQSGKATVAGDPDPNAPLSKQYAAPDAEEPATAAPAAKPAAGAAPGGADDEVGGPTAQPSAGDINKAGPAGTAQAKPLQGAAKIAADKTAAATAGQDQVAAGQTMYAQVKANIDKLDKKGKQRILQLLQKSIAAPAGGGAAGGGAAGGGAAGGKPAAPAAGAAPAAEPQAAPAAGGAPEKVAAPGEEPAGAGAGAMGSMVNQLGGKPANTMANAPVSKTNKAKPGNPNAAPAGAAPAAEPQTAPAAEPAPAGQPAPKRTGGKVKGQVSMTPNAVRKREKRLGKQQPQGQSQAELDADRDRLMGNFSDSIERHKQRMVAEAFSRGEISLFRKK